MPQYEVRIKKIEVSYCWVTVNAKDAANAEQGAIRQGPSLAKSKSFGEPEPALYEADECLKVVIGAGETPES